SESRASSASGSLPRVRRQRQTAWASSGRGTYRDRAADGPGVLQRRPLPDVRADRVKRTKPALEHLSRPTPPWVELVVLRPGHVLADIDAALPGFAVRRLDGGQCATKDALLRTLARTLDFPAHFGLNWDALEDSLTDLEWLPAAGYVLVISEAHRLLPGNDAD